MTCSEFLERFSTYHDGASSPSEAEAMRAHASVCASCRRYEGVVRRGTDLLRDLPHVKPREDFHERLRHSIYAIEEERRRKSLAGDGTRLGATLLVAAALALLVWIPMQQGTEPVVELAPIVAREPVPPLPLLPEAAAPLPWGSPVQTPTPAALFSDANLWSRSNALLYEHSYLSRRVREGGVVRTGLP